LIPINVFASDSPEKIVENYCQHDFEGSRLSGKTWREIANLITWQDEPGWDIITVISSFAIIDSKQGENEADVIVEYSPSMNIQPGEQYEILTDPKRIDFHLQNVNGIWKISSPMIMPHVSEEVVLKRLE
jgi:hypothetical protein